MSNIAFGWRGCQNTGEVWHGVQAKELGLIDMVGTEDNAIAKMGGGKKLEPVYFGPEKPGMGLFAAFSTALTTSIRAAVVEAASEPPSLN